MLKRQI